MEAFLNRKYKFNRHDDQFDSYLASLGMNFITRKLAKSIPSSCEIIKIGEDEFAYNTILPFKTHQQKFKLGEETVQETCDGRKVKNVFTFDGKNKIIERQIEPDREVVIVREFSEKELFGVATVNNNVKCEMWSEFVES